MGWSCRRSAKQAGQQRDQGHADQGDAAARDKLLDALRFLLMCDKEVIEV